MVPMATTPTNRLPEFITDGGIETHIIFNMGVDLPHSAFPLNDSATGREVIRRVLPRLPASRPSAARRGFLFATDSWRASS